MITFVIFAVLAILVADALYSRARIKLRTRAAQAATKRPSHELTEGGSRGGWRPWSRCIARPRLRPAAWRTKILSFGSGTATLGAG